MNDCLNILFVERAEGQHANLTCLIDNIAVNAMTKRATLSLERRGSHIERTEADKLGWWSREDAWTLRRTLEVVVQQGD